MKKITKLTFYAVGIIALSKTTKYLLEKNKKVEKINYPTKKEVKKVEIVDNKNKRNYIDITDIVINDLNKEKHKCK